MRPFRRSDRDQLTRLINAHAGAVVPGLSASVNTVLGSLERQPGEFTGHTEIVYLARVEDLPSPARPPLRELSVRRSVGINGCRLSALLGQDVIGYVEVEAFDEGERLTRTAGWADEDYRAFLPAVGFGEITRTERGWTRSGSAGSV
jgi:hypothetical protein